MNKLVWPAPLGIGGLDAIHFQREYDYLAEMNITSRSYDASTNVVPSIINSVIANLAGEGHDVYGFRYATEAHQITLEYCPGDGQGGQAVLCAMRCRPGSEPPPGGQVYHADDCLPCAQGTASPGGTEPCLPCLEGHDAPSASMAQCVAPSSRALYIGLAVAAAVVFTALVLLGALLFVRGQALQRELKAMQHADPDAMDMDSPFVKVLVFLQELGQGEHAHVLRPWKKDGMERKARELRAMLLQSKNISAPDVKAQMAGHFSEDIVRFVLEHTMDDTHISPGSSDPSIRHPKRSSVESPRPSSFDMTHARVALSGQLSLVGQSFALDSFHLHSLCPSGLLAVLAVRFCEDWGLSKRLNLSMSRLATFANVIESGHQDNPYHCLAHTIDVTARLAAILNKSGIAAHMTQPYSGRKGPLTLLGALIAALGKCPPGRSGCVGPAMPTCACRCRQWMNGRGSC